MRLAWEGMIPTALLLVFIVSVFVYYGLTSYLWIGSIVAIIIIAIARPLLLTSATNKRIELLGSRFSAPKDHA